MYLKEKSNIYFNLDEIQDHDMIVMTPLLYQTIKINEGLKMFDL